MWKKRECRLPRKEQSVTFVRWWITSHISCQSRSNGFVKHTAAAMQVHESSLMNTRKDQVIDEVTQNQESTEGRERPVKMEASDNILTSFIVMDRPTSHKNGLSSNDVTSPHRVKINEESVECLYDSGATCCAVKRELTTESDSTGKESWCTLIEGDVQYYPIAKILLENLACRYHRASRGSSYGKAYKTCHYRNN